MLDLCPILLQYVDVVKPCQSAQLYRALQSQLAAHPLPKPKRHELADSSPPLRVSSLNHHILLVSSSGLSGLYQKTVSNQTPLQRLRLQEPPFFSPVQLTRIRQWNLFSRPVAEIMPDGRHYDQQRWSYRPNNCRVEDGWILVRRPADIAEWLSEEAGGGHCGCYGYEGAE